MSQLFHLSSLPLPLLIILLSVLHIVPILFPLIILSNAIVVLVPTDSYSDPEAMHMLWCKENGLENLSYYSVAM